MIGRRDPADLTESERFQEIADLLARGVLRRHASHHDSDSNPKNRLDDRGQREAPCVSHALNPKTKEPAA